MQFQQLCFVLLVIQAAFTLDLKSCMGAVTQAY